jgi:hypothetical protein
LSSKRIKRKKSKPSFLRRIHEIACQANAPERQRPLLLRDADGFVHRSNGFLSAAEYMNFRERHASLGFPRYEDIPPMSALSKRQLGDWYLGKSVDLDLCSSARDGMHNSSLPANEEHDEHAIARFEGEGGAVGAHQ